MHLAPPFYWYPHRPILDFRHALNHIIEGRHFEKYFWSFQLVGAIGAAMWLARTFFYSYFLHEINTISKVSLSYCHWWERKYCCGFFQKVWNLISKINLPGSIIRIILLSKYYWPWDFGYLATAQPQFWLFLEKQLIFTETCKYQL